MIPFQHYKNEHSRNMQYSLKMIDSNEIFGLYLKYEEYLMSMAALNIFFLCINGFL